MNLLHPIKARRANKIDARLENLSDQYASELRDEYYEGNGGPFRREIIRFPRGIRHGEFMSQLYDRIDQKLGSSLLEHIERDEGAALLRDIANCERANVGTPEDVIIVSGYPLALCYVIEQTVELSLTQETF